MPIALRTADVRRTIELLRLVEMNADPVSALDAKRLADMFSEQLSPSTIIITGQK